MDQPTSVSTFLSTAGNPNTAMRPVQEQGEDWEGAALHVQGAPKKHILLDPSTFIFTIWKRVTWSMLVHQVRVNEYL